jgi:hypothetical protein
MIQVEMDRIYKNIPLEEIPWNIETPPDALVELVDSGKVKSCELSERIALNRVLSKFSFY